MFVFLICYEQNRRNGKELINPFKQRVYLTKVYKIIRN